MGLRITALCSAFLLEGVLFFEREFGERHAEGGAEHFLGGGEDGVEGARVGVEDCRIPCQLIFPRSGRMVLSGVAVGWLYGLSTFLAYVCPPQRLSRVLARQSQAD